MQIVVRMLLAYLAAVVATVMECLVTDPETAGGGLTVSLFIVPSVLIFGGLATTGRRFRTAKHIAFGLSLMPVTGCMVFVWCRGGEGSDMAAQIGYWYALQALVAYAVLLAIGQGGRANGPAAGSANQELETKRG